MMKQSYILISLFLTIALVQASSGDVCGVVFSQDMLSIFFTGVIFSSLLISLWYMVGKLLDSPDIESVTKVEIQQVGITIVIALILSGLLQILCNISVSPEGIELGQKNALMLSTESKVKDAMKLTLEAYLDMSQALFDYAAVGSASTGFIVYGNAVYFSPFPVYSFIGQAIAPVSKMTLFAYFSLVFQYVLLKIVHSQVFLALLPIGLALRAFPIVRKFGGVLIGVSLGMSFIYPLIVAIGFAAIEPISYKHLDGISPMEYLLPVGAIMLAATLGGAVTALGPLVALISAITAFTSTAAILALPLGFDIGLGDFVTGDLRSLYASFGTIMLVAFFMPALEVLIVSAIVRSLSASLGTETDISGILRAI